MDASSLAARVYCPPQHPGRQLRRFIPETTVIETMTPDISAWLDCFYLAGAALFAAALSFPAPRDEP